MRSLRVQPLDQDRLTSGSTRLVVERNLGGEASSTSGGLSIKCPPESRDPISQAIQSGSAAKFGSADAVVSDFHVQLAIDRTSP